MGQTLSRTYSEEYLDAFPETFSGAASKAASECKKHVKSKGQSKILTHSSLTRSCAQQVEKDELCKDCQRIDFAAILDISAITLQENLRSGVFIANLGHRLSQVAHSACPLCHLFFQMRILAPRLSESHEYHLRAYTVFSHFNSMSLSGCPERLASKDLPCLAVVSSSSTGAAIPDSHVKFLYCHSSQYNEKRIFIPRPIGTSVEFSTIKKILAYCKSKHRNLCPDSRPTISGMKLINCNKPAKTISALDIEPFPSNCPPYIALSYVWGKLNNDNGGLGVNTNETVPRVVSDAMTATAELGYEYLWVDRFCIDQLNHSERDYQTSRMDEIYKGAEVTLVAATGEDASSGLAGVGKTGRIPQQSLSLGKIQLISSMHNPRQAIEASKWFTRSWTLQEGVLSHRRLVFTPYEIYFECESMHWRESWAAELDDLHSHGRFRKFLSPGIFTGRSSSGGTTSRSCTMSLKRFDRLLSEYSTKKFSPGYGETDSLRAFQGIIHNFEKSKYPVFQLWGMPFTWSYDRPSESSQSFLASLLWRHKRSVFSGETKPQRRSDFPSWSCLGWEGEVVIPARLWPNDKNFVSMVENFVLQTEHGFQESVELSSPLFLSRLGKHHVTKFRSLKFEAFKLLRTQLNFRVRRTNESWDSPNIRLGDSDIRASIHMSGGAVKTRSFACLLLSGQFDFVLLAMQNKVIGARKNSRLTFLIVKPARKVDYRAGIMVVKTDLETFKKHFILQERRVVQLR